MENRHSAVVDSLFIVAAIVLGVFFVLGPCFVTQYFVSFLVLLSSCLGRELIALLCLPDVL